MQSHLIDPELQLPTSEELPCSDDTPVDNENQNTIPNWLLAILEEIWGERQDWFFGVDMGIYDREAQKKRDPVVPILALEFVSQTYNQEYGEKMVDYARLGVKYYAYFYIKLIRSKSRKQISKREKEEERDRDRL